MEYLAFLADTTAMAGYPKPPTSTDSSNFVWATPCKSKQTMCKQTP